MRAMIYILALWCVNAVLACAWSDPILVTPDMAVSVYPRTVFDDQGFMHVFFSNRRYQTVPPIYHYDVFHCKLTQNGVRLTEDLRLDTTSTDLASRPSPVFGSDGKLHVLWDDFSYFPSQHGLYYARLNTEGRLERPATRIVSGSDGPPRLFMDSDANLNTVWGMASDSLMYCKFDTSGNVLISPTLIHIEVYANVEACMDSQDRIHMTYRHYWGSWNEFNVGCTRLDNQGQVEVLYYPLIPEEPGTYAGQSDIAVDV